MIGGGYFVITGSWSWTVVLASLPYALGVTGVIFGKHIDKYEMDKERTHSHPAGGDWGADCPYHPGGHAHLAICAHLCVGHHGLLHSCDGGSSVGNPHLAENLAYVQGS